MSFFFSFSPALSRWGRVLQVESTHTVLDEQLFEIGVHSRSFAVS